MKRYIKGFTLIELLVVIAIIGILASVVLVSLQSARKKGNDARVISSVQQIRTLLESNYNGTGYTDLTGANRFALPAAANTTRKTLEDDILAQQTAGGMTALYSFTAGGVFVANATLLITKTADDPGKGYAIYAKLPSDPTKIFCLDSVGGSKTSTANILGSVAGAVDITGLTDAQASSCRN